MKEHRIGIIMNGVTGRMGTNQHLMRSIVEIIKQGGVKVGAAEIIMPDPVLVGRDADKLATLADASGVTRCTTDLDRSPRRPAQPDLLRCPDHRPPRRRRCARP